jgi:hypothetical protein
MTRCKHETGTREAKHNWYTLVRAYTLMMAEDLRMVMFSRQCRQYGQEEGRQEKSQWGQHKMKGERDLGCQWGNEDKGW